MAAILSEPSLNALNTNQAILANTDVLGMGRYGIILSKALDNKTSTEPIQTFPNHVMKIMIPTNKDKPSKELEEERKKIINQFMSNNNGRHIYKYTRKFKPSMFTVLKNKIKSPALKNAIDRGKNIDLNVYHMPNLGVSLYTTLSEIRSSPKHPMKNTQNINTIVKQLCKLLRQIHRLVKLKWIHGDIFSMNIMVNLSSFIFTLIDFDWLYSMKEFPIKYSHAFGHFINPPEVFLAHHNNMLTEYLKTKIIPFLQERYGSIPNVIFLVNKWSRIVNLGVLSDDNINMVCQEFNDVLRVSNYIQSLLTSYLHDTRHAYVQKNDTFIKINDRKTKLDEITRSYIEINPDNIVDIKTKFIETYDSYCISTCFLELLYTMYPDIIGKQKDPENVFTSIFTMIHEVLLPLAELNWEKRVHIDDVIDKIEEIEAQINLQQHINTIFRNKLHNTTHYIRNNTETSKINQGVTQSTIVSQNTRNKTFVIGTKQPEQSLKNVYKILLHLNTCEGVMKIRDITQFDQTTNILYTNFKRGGDLNKYLKTLTIQTLNKDAIKYIVINIAKTINCIHSKGVVHLDIKAANIVLDEDLNPTLIDFTGSQFMLSANGKCLYKRDKMYITQFLVSPELHNLYMQNLHSDFYFNGIFHDIYSFACLLLHILFYLIPLNESYIHLFINIIKIILTELNVQLDDWLVFQIRCIFPRSVINSMFKVYKKLFRLSNVNRHDNHLTEFEKEVLQQIFVYFIDTHRLNSILSNPVPNDPVPNDPVPNDPVPNVPVINPMRALELAEQELQPNSYLGGNNITKYNKKNSTNTKKHHRTKKNKNKKPF